MSADTTTTTTPPPATTTTTTNPAPPSQQEESISSSSPSEMSISPSRAATLISNLTSVTTRIIAATASLDPAPPTHPKNPIRLVAVSKLKPASDILALHNPPTLHVHFGENYVQELLEKSRVIPAENIRWHFIGGLQSNKCVTLARDVKGLWAVESVDTEKKATLLDKGWGERERGESNSSSHHDDGDDRLRVFVQVNTSGEESKAGVDPAQTAKLCAFIREKCPRLKLQGLMTIGAIARSKATTSEAGNEDFVCLRNTRDTVCKELGLEGDEELELSMGMSEDFEGAIAMGSNEVRVGSTIFGERPPKAQAKVV
ncbi:YggS family pyridoxal phosphate enzyme [Polytolypa hystricis UAMH7299]|uniref:Pyridoxal phosphate homeostasis protein n=1 Tax=Polytolypa hystricis (strain UAMH7299) TaxID=1447883 RepID=A0A2B7XRP6_POLH7|nr:YggS family pyridoxal phosphate enzyme [Polytolypa hystricis UAMH7299]